MSPIESDGDTLRSWRYTSLLWLPLNRILAHNKIFTDHDEIFRVGPHLLCTCALQDQHLLWPHKMLLEAISLYFPFIYFLCCGITAKTHHWGKLSVKSLNAGMNSAFITFLFLQLHRTSQHFTHVNLCLEILMGGELLETRILLFKRSETTCDWPSKLHRYSLIDGATTKGNIAVSRYFSYLVHSHFVFSSAML